MYGGAIIVDSTRRGKTIPDALAKTVPIWVGVVNRVLFPEERWRHTWEVRVPGVGVGESERSQIEGRVEGWCEGFRGLGLDLERLRRECGRPVRVVWAVNGEWEGEGDGAVGREQVEDGNNLLVLCSASRRVRGAEVSEGGYIQGAGDDSEGWARGLTPPMFWRYLERLLKTKEEELPDLITEILDEEKKTKVVHERVLVKPTKIIYLADGERLDDDQFNLIINCTGKSAHPFAIDSDKVLDLQCREGKLGSKDLRERLGTVKSFVGTALQRKPHCRILIMCSSGKDLSVGVALALLCLFFDDSGSLKSSPPQATIDKAFVKTRLAWITACKPDANPSRSTLQAVNSFLIDRPS